ncbi:hypothetical protein ACO0RG_000682 [Hanseniaspora osmophila]|uniref:tRNA-specific adenosine deaminase subunit TAD3 n=1 Tax=Hanseniaspora osmophila TaxID=56408 RepID=A0A1E5R1H1_9ASCO|nr:tRNA-specific adenosine deaminase subunit TAD3 [Hanseniaspora osmophila]
MVKKIHNPVKIDYVNCLVEDCLQQIKGADSMTTSAQPHEFLSCWVIEIKNKALVQKFVRFAKENIPSNELDGLQNVKKIKVENGALKFIPCSTDTIQTKEKLQELIAEHTKADANDYLLLDQLALIPKTSPPTKEIALEWGKSYWPLTWRGNPNDQVLNDMEYDMVKINKYLKEISELSATCKNTVPSVTIFSNSRQNKLYVAYDERDTTGNPLDHSVMCGIKQVAENLPKDGYLCLDYEVFTTHEPCAMCCMALVHSRISRLFYIQDVKHTGSLKSNYHMHGIKSLNSKYHVFQYVGDKYHAAAVEQSAFV